MFAKQNISASIVVPLRQLVINLRVNRAVATNTLPRPSSSQTSANPKSRKSRNKIDRLSASPSTAGVTNYAKVLGLFAESSASSDISHTSGGASTSSSWPV